MAPREPDFLNITDGESRTSYFDSMSVHLQKVLGHEFDSTFIKSECMAEMTRICYRCRGCNVDVSLDETQ